jgi:TRAP-type mannitol/chloroaromatic compound transport system permease small subunit
LRAKNWGDRVALLARLLDGVLGRTLAILKWLAIPIGLMLFLQWPLRDYVKAYSREANDLGQWLFALYVAAAVTAATRAGTHLAVDTLAKRYRARTRRVLVHICNLVALGPWAILILVTGTPPILASISHWERFPDTGNPGYFIIKASLWLMAGMVLLSIALDLLGRKREGDR